MEVPSHFSKAMLFALIATFSLACAWEIYWRQRDYPLSYNEDNAAWANARAKVDANDEPKMVIIGSSRGKFDVDLPALKQKTGFNPIQLSLHGSCPRPALVDLANDSLFTGTLLIDVMEPLFFAMPGIPPYTEIQKRVEYYSRWTPAQQASHKISRALESKLVFLDQEAISLNGLYTRTPMAPREGVWTFPVFPLGWAYVCADRQNKLSDAVLNSTEEQQKIRNVWMQLGMLNSHGGPGGDTLQFMFDVVKASIDKLKKRGVQVFFIRFPSTDVFLEAEHATFPRKMYWDRLLEYTQTPGIHFEDYPVLKKYKCPEGSHLSPADAIDFTKEVVEIMKRDKGWKTPDASM
ncbi:MAG: hypothetical protein ABIS36_25365 [Chryseolinea sp.]